MRHARCQLCGEKEAVAKALGVCAACLRRGAPGSLALAHEAHTRVRRRLGLPPAIPSSEATAACTLCANACRPEDGEPGVCGARMASGRSVRPRVGTASAAAVSFWHDALPTNCSASLVCAGSRDSARGGRNLAVGYHGCSFDCLYCQSWEARTIEGAPRHSAAEVAAAVDEEVRCVCFFGGDPTPQIGHALATARLALRQARREGRTLRLCFETNGSMGRPQLDAMIDLSLESGGCIKFDLKAFDPLVHLALTGSDNARTLEGFAHLASRRRERPDPPLAIAATPLVPGYVDSREVRALARFVASLGKDVPYLLLGFFPCFELADLNPTSRRQARRCVRAARAAGLERVFLTNRHVLVD